MWQTGTSEQVTAMYSKWPYPSAIAGTDLLYDLASLFQLLLPKEMCQDIEVLDAGCGSGHRLVGFAKRFPRARFTGIDMTDASLDIARQLAAKHGVTNVTFLKQNLLDLDLDGKFDVITSTGVIHHVEKPAEALSNLCKILTDEGIISIWHYHSIGERRRLEQRELLRALWIDKSDLAAGMALMRDLGLSVDRHKYGSSAKHGDGSALDIESLDVDAFMHPIVNAYRFQEGIDMFSETCINWLVVNGINMVADSKLLDLDGVEVGALRPLCLSMDQLLPKDSLITNYRRLNKIDRLKVIELQMEPTGFTLLAGKGNSLSRLSKRVQANCVWSRVPPAGNRERNVELAPL